MKTNLGEVVGAAVARRARNAPPYPVGAYRVINGPADGAPPGLTVDRYDRWVVVGARTHLDDDTVERWVDAVAAELEPAGVVLKRLASQIAESTTRVARGTVPGEAVWVEEGEIRLGAYLNDGVQTGIFLDQREARRRARAFAVQKEVLNLFAYTGAFTAHAVHAGARRVTSVDVSKKALMRARANLQHNGHDPDAHRWFTDDVMTHLKRASPETYGLVIVDPPVFGHGKGRPFSLLRDLDRLIARSLVVTQRDGVVMFSAHARALDRRSIERALHRAARSAARSIDRTEWLGLPAWDHPVDAGHRDSLDRGDYLATAVIRTSG